MNYLDPYQVPANKNVPNPIAERGLKAAWKHNRHAVRNLVIAATVIAAVVYMFSQNKKEKRMLHAWSE